MLVSRRIRFSVANLLDTDAASNEHDALDLIHVQTRRRKDKATSYAHFDLLPLYVFYRLP